MDRRVGYFFIFAFILGCGVVGVKILIEDLDANLYTDVFSGLHPRLTVYVLLIALLYIILIVGCLAWIMISEDVTAKKKALTAMNFATFGVAVFTVLYILILSTSLLASDELGRVKPDIFKDKDVSKAVDDMQRNLQCCGLYSFNDWYELDTFECKDDYSCEFPKHPISCLKEIEVAELVIQNHGIMVDSPKFQGVKYFLNSDQILVVYNLENEVQFEDLIHNTGCLWRVHEMKYEIIKHLFIINLLMAFSMWITREMMKKMVYSMLAYEQVIYKIAVVTGNANDYKEALMNGITDV